MPATAPRWVEARRRKAEGRGGEGQALVVELRPKVWYQETFHNVSRVAVLISFGKIYPGGQVDRLGNAKVAIQAMPNRVCTISDRRQSIPSHTPIGMHKI